jgi:hypothetical protein
MCKGLDSILSAAKKQKQLNKNGKAIILQIDLPSFMRQREGTDRKRK